MKMRIILALVFLELFLILGFTALCVYVCFVFGNSIFRIMFPLGLWDLTIMVMFYLGIDEYKEKHQNYYVVYVKKNKIEER